MNLYKTILIFLFYISICGSVFSQKIAGIAYENIQLLVNDSTGIYYYPSLVERFAKLDTALKQIDFLMLYYGYSATEAYHPFRHLEWEDSVANLNQKKQYKEASALSDLLLKSNPVSLFGNIEKAIALYELKAEKASYLFLEKYRLLVAAIESSGLGNSYENPIYLITPKDAEAIIRRYELTTLSKSLNGQSGRYYQVYLVKNKENKEYPIYFDISLPQTIGMQKLQKELKKNNK